MRGHKRQWPEECFAAGKNSMFLWKIIVVVFFGYDSKNPIFAIIDKKTSPLLLCGSTHRYSPTSLFKVFSHICRGGPMCPPASEMILEFANMSSKLTFLQCNQVIIKEECLVKGASTLLFADKTLL